MIQSLTRDLIMLWTCANDNLIGVCRLTLFLAIMCVIMMHHFRFSYAHCSEYPASVFTQRLTIDPISCDPICSSSLTRDFSHSFHIEKMMLTRPRSPVEYGASMIEQYFHFARATFLSRNFFSFSPLFFCEGKIFFPTLEVLLSESVPLEIVSDVNESHRQLQVALFFDKFSRKPLID